MSFLHLSAAEAADAAQLPEKIDVVTALHACDTATDDAIAFGLRKHARFMVLVPCCQAELAGCLRESKALALARTPLSELWRHPLHTRELGSQVTNVLRCLYLEAMGYQVTVTELVGWEHSMKNELIIATNKNLPRRRPAERLREVLADRAELVPAGELVAGLREVKDPGEVDRIRAAAHLADAALTEVLGRGLAGRTERDVAVDIEIELRRTGADSVSFQPIVASGANGALPHAEPRDVAIEPGALVTIDWGARLEGYCSDCTRTFAVGEVGDDQREIYELVLRAQQAALAVVRPGPTGREVDAVARDLIDEAGHADHFGHGLGHGVGLEIHEAPRLSRQSEARLVAGNVVTVEPGVYVPERCGVRIEDLVVVTDDGHEVLSTLPKELQVVA
jgi:Xaa-Pro aminopeptidase